MPGNQTLAPRVRRRHGGAAKLSDRGEDCLRAPHAASLEPTCLFQPRMAARSSIASSVRRSVRGTVTLVSEPNAASAIRGRYPSYPPRLRQLPAKPRGQKRLTHGPGRSSPLPGQASIAEPQRSRAGRGDHPAGRSRNPCAEGKGSDRVLPVPNGNMCRPAPLHIPGLCANIMLAATARPRLTSGAAGPGWCPGALGGETARQAVRHPDGPVLIAATGDGNSEDTTAPKQR